MPRIFNAKNDNGLFIFPTGLWIAFFDQEHLNFFVKEGFNDRECKLAHIHPNSTKRL